MSNPLFSAVPPDRPAPKTAGALRAQHRAEMADEVFTLLSRYRHNAVKKGYEGPALVLANTIDKLRKDLTK